MVERDYAISGLLRMEIPYRCWKGTVPFGQLWVEFSTDTGQTVCDTWAAWNYVASCGSSTTEGASDVSLFHTCLTFPLALAGGCLLWVLCLVGVFVCFSGFASARVVF